MKQSRNEVLKIRYQVYRKLGYDSATSRALSFRSLDVSGLEISKKTGKLKRNTTTKQYIEKDMELWKNKDVIDKYNHRVAQPIYTNQQDITQPPTTGRVYSPHATLVRDKKYRGETGKIISIIKHENKLSNDQAYYFFYLMTRYNMSYKETKTMLLSNKEFEEYTGRK